MNNGFPELSDSFLLGQDILYSQFNDINFYVEDTDQEHFYFNILIKLFPNVSFEKIFPLNGKDNVVIESKLTTDDKTKVYIVDLDFDEILNKNRLIVNITERVNILDEIVISPENIEKFLDLKEEEFKGFDYVQDKSTKLENIILRQGQLYNGIDFINVAKLISKLILNN